MENLAIRDFLLSRGLMARKESIESLEIEGSEITAVILEADEIGHNVEMIDLFELLDFMYKTTIAS